MSQNLQSTKLAEDQPSPPKHETLPPSYNGTMIRRDVGYKFQGVDMPAIRQLCNLQVNPEDPHL